MSLPDTDTYHTRLLASLTTINTHNPPVHTCSTGWSFKGLISGPTSIAYLFYRLSTLYPEDFEWKGQGFLEWAEAYIRLGGQGWHGGMGGDEFGAGSYVGCDEGTTWIVVDGIIEGDEGVVDKVVGMGRRSVDEVVEGIDGIRLAWWAGYLYLLRVLKTAFPGSKSVGMLRDITERVVKVMLSCNEVRTGEFGVGKLELMVGVVTQILLSRHQRHIDGLDKVLGTILGLQDQRTGDWGSGTAFIVNSLESIKMLLPQQGKLRERVAVADDRARNFLSRVDVGTLPPTMQLEGLVTLALAFTDPEDQNFDNVLAGLTSEALDDTRPEWKRDAGIKDQWVGLRTGEAGRAWVWALAELTTMETDDKSDMVKRRILGYNDI